VNRRALEQLRRSRTKVTSATGGPTLPDNVAGVPIVITDSLANDERAAAGMVFAPTGQRPSAQGCEARATLGHPIKLFINPNGVASFVNRRMQPIQG